MLYCNNTYFGTKLLKFCIHFTQATTKLKKTLVVRLYVFPHLFATATLCKIPYNIVYYSAVFPTLQFITVQNSPLYSLLDCIAVQCRSVLEYPGRRRETTALYPGLASTLQCNVLHCTTLHCTNLRCTVMHCSAMHYTTLQ